MWNKISCYSYKNNKKNNIKIINHRKNISLRDYRKLMGPRPIPQVQYEFRGKLINIFIRDPIVLIYGLNSCVGFLGLSPKVL